MHGVQCADLDVNVGTELPDAPGDPDVIVTQIPYQPGEARDVAAVIDQSATWPSGCPRAGSASCSGRLRVLTGELTAYSAVEDGPRETCSRTTWWRRSSGCPAA